MLRPSQTAYSQVKRRKERAYRSTSYEHHAIKSKNLHG